MLRLHRRCRWMILLAGIGLALVAARSFRHGLYAADAMMRPPRVSVSRPHDGPGAAGLIDVSFPSSGTTILRGWYSPSSNGAAVILVHGYGGNRTAVWPEARALVARGYGALLFDLQAHGESGGDVVTFGDQERDNVLAALDLVAARPEVDPARVGVFGFSMGGWAATAVAARDPRVRALVLAGVTSSFEEQELDGLGSLSALALAGQRWEFRRAGVDLAAARPVDFIGAIAPRPVLLLRGSLDTTVPAKWVDALFAAAREPKELWTLEGAGHGGYFEARGQAYTDRLVAFFDRALRVPP